MPKGIDVLIENGFATLDFVDRSTRGPGLAALLNNTPAVMVEKLTRSGPRVQYRVPEGNAREAGLLDGATVVDGHADRQDLHFADELVAANTSGEGDWDWHTPTPGVDGNAYSAGRDGANAHIRGPLRPNKPVADSVPPPPAGASTRTSDLQKHVKTSTPRPAEYTPNSAPQSGAGDDYRETDGVPTTDWSVADMRAYAKANGIDLSGVAKKGEILSKIVAATS